MHCIVVTPWWASALTLAQLQSKDLSAETLVCVHRGRHEPTTVSCTLRAVWTAEAVCLSALLSQRAEKASSEVMTVVFLEPSLFLLDRIKKNNHLFFEYDDRYGSVPWKHPVKATMQEKIFQHNTSTWLKVNIFLEAWIAPRAQMFLVFIGNVYIYRNI